MQEEPLSVSINRNIFPRLWSHSSSLIDACHSVGVTCGSYIQDTMHRYLLLGQPLPEDCQPTQIRYCVSTQLLNGCT